ncbi:hypothetical protein FALBO_17089, partial [Fusarium albosuccineum]
MTESQLGICQMTTDVSYDYLPDGYLSPETVDSSDSIEYEDDEDDEDDEEEDEQVEEDSLISKGIEETKTKEEDEEEEEEEDVGSSDSIEYEDDEDDEEDEEDEDDEEEEEEEEDESDNSEQNLRYYYRKCYRHTAFSPCTKLLASTFDRGIITIWCWSTNSRHHTLKRHDGNVTALGFSSDGQLLAS